MTPSDEAVERLAKALYDEGRMPPSLSWDAWPEHSTGHPKPGKDYSKAGYRGRARALLVAAFPSGVQPGGEFQIAPDSSKDLEVGEYRRAISDVVVWLRARTAMQPDHPEAALIHHVTDDLVREFGPREQGEES